MDQEWTWTGSGPELDNIEKWWIFLEMPMKKFGEEERERTLERVNTLFQASSRLNHLTKV